MEDVRRCDRHGHFPAESCPACDRPGERVLAGERRRRLSRFLSGALRHFPGDVGLALDGKGWTAFGDLVTAATRQYDWADRGAVEGVVATDPKGRFERDDGRVRATYGHSVDVTIDGEAGSVPDTLYHGTPARNLDAIHEDGLRPMERQQVHLSASTEDARTVGRRHTREPVVLAVDAAGMERDGHHVAKRGEATYTTDRVPPEYLRVIER